MEKSPFPYSPFAIRVSPRLPRAPPGSYSPGHARPQRPHLRDRQARADRQGLRHHPDRRPGRAGRPQRRRQDHAVPRHRRRDRCRRTARSRCRRARASAGWRRRRRTARKACSTSCWRPTASARGSCAEAETAHDPHRIAEIQTRLADIGAHSAPARAAADPRRPRLLPCRAAAALRANSPAAGACGWRSPPRCSPSPTCCCSTSRPTISTSKARCGSRSTSRAIRAPCS